MVARNNYFERLKSIHPIQDLWFKSRTIFKINRYRYEFHELDHDDYIVEEYTGRNSLSDVDSESVEFLYEHVGEDITKERLRNPSCALFLAREDNTSNSPVGFYWSVIARLEPVWHDNYKLDTNHGLVFNAYVAESYRCQGIYRLLQKASHNHLFKETECKSVITIVENRNTTSMRANRKFGLQAAGSNYLLKLMSLNICSVIKNDSTKIYFVLSRSGYNEVSQ